MPIRTPALKQRLIGTLKGERLLGTAVSNLAGGVSLGVVKFLPSITVRTTDNGLLGGGTGFGGITLNIRRGTQILNRDLLGAGIKGSSRKKIASGVAKGVGSEMNSNAAVQTIVSGVATGSGTGNLTGMNQGQFFTILLSSLKANQVAGSGAKNLSKGLSSGIISWFETGTVTTQDQGTPVQPPSPSTGTGTGSIS